MYFSVLVVQINMNGFTTIGNNVFLYVIFAYTMYNKM